MDNRKIKAIQLLIEGKLNLEEIAEKINITIKTLKRWEKMPDFINQRKAIESEIRNSLREKITYLTDKLISSISKNADEIPPRESLEMLLKILEKSEKIGFNRPISTEKNPEIQSMSDEELKRIIEKYINEDRIDE